jgi:hypothetical protein
MASDQELPDGWQFNTGWEISPDAKTTSGLKKLLAHITTRGGLSPEKIHGLMVGVMRDGYVPSHDTIRLIMKSKKEIYSFKRRDEFITLVYFIGRYSSEEKDVFASLSDGDAKAFHQDCELYFKLRSRDDDFRDRYLLTKPRSAYAGRSISAAFDLLSTLNSLGLSQQTFLGAKKAVFSDDEISAGTGGEKHYFAYRFGLEPSYVFKSLISLFGQQGDTSPVTFTHLLKDRFGDLRTTRGFALSIANRLYLIGNLGNGTALEMAAFKDFSPQRALISGLMMSVSALSEMLTGRVALRSVVKPDSSEVCRKPYDDLKAEIDGFKEMLTNRVDFRS